MRRVYEPDIREIGTERKPGAEPHSHKEGGDARGAHSLQTIEEGN